MKDTLLRNPKLRGARRTWCISTLVLLVAIPLSMFPDRSTANRASAADYSVNNARYFQLHDGLADYWMFLKANRTASSDVRIKSFRDIVINPHIEAYDSVAHLWLGDDKNLGRFVEALNGKTPQFRQVDSIFPSRMSAAWAKFQAYAPDLKPGAPVFLLAAPRIAIGGSVRPLRSQDALILGSEELSTVIESQRAFDVLINHEMTHLYHQQVNAEMRRMVAAVYMPPYAPGPTKIYQVLFLEGLAAYTSKRLNPTAPDSEVLLSDTVASEVKVLWPAIGTDIREHLNSSEKKDVDKYLFDGQVSQVFPRRAGYYVGMLIAAELSKKYPFAKLCRMSGVELQSEVEAALLDLEKSGI